MLFFFLQLLLLLFSSHSHDDVIRTGGHQLRSHAYQMFIKIGGFGLCTPNGQHTTRASIVRIVFHIHTRYLRHTSLSMHGLRLFSYGFSLRHTIRALRSSRELAIDTKKNFQLVISQSVIFNHAGNNARNSRFVRTGAYYTNHYSSECYR